MTESITTRLAQWAKRLTYDDIPAHTVTLTISQIISNIATVRASMSHPLGKAIIASFGQPDGRTSKQSACTMAALSMCFEFDEVAYSGHLSASCVNVALAYAQELGRSGEQIIAATVAANECAARFQSAIIFGPIFRGQSATYIHLVGAAVARLHGMELDDAAWTHALGLSFGILPVPHEHSFLASDAKIFVAATPVRSALDACDAALHGLTGAPDVLEGPAGVLAKLADAPMPDMITDRLGRRWHTDTLSFKKYPASAYLQAAFECAELLYPELGSASLQDITKIEVRSSVLTALLDAKVEPYLLQERSAVAALTFSVGFGIASILTRGRLTVAGYEAESVSDQQLWAIANKVTVVEDRGLTEAMVRATVPMGEILRQAGDRVEELPIIRDLPQSDLDLIKTTLGPPEESFEAATMAIGATVSVLFGDGRRIEKTRPQCTGMAGPDTRRDHRTLASNKYLDTGGSKSTLKALERLAELDGVQAAAAIWSAILE